MEHSDFAKIIRLEDGSQALFYFEPDGDEYIFHQIFSFGYFQADLKICGVDMDAAQQHAHLEGLTIEDANRLKARLAFGTREFIGLDEEVGHASVEL